MFYYRKLKTSQSFTDLMLIGAIYLISFVTLIFTGFETALLVMGALVFIYGLYSLFMYFLTRNTGYLVISLFQFSMAMLCTSIAYGMPRENFLPSTIFLLSALFFGIWAVNLAINKRSKWRGREILELAAMPVEESADGYTGRPYPAGSIEGSRKEILEFAQFASKNLIAVTRIEPEKVFFLPVMSGREYSLLFDLRAGHDEKTWVSFDLDGNVAVNIAMNDYLTYQEDLSFNQLCESLGGLFIEFFELFRRGEGVRIIDRMDALGLSAFS